MSVTMILVQHILIYGGFQLNLLKISIKLIYSFQNLIFSEISVVVGDQNWLKNEVIFREI